MNGRAWNAHRRWTTLWLVLGVSSGVGARGQNAADDLAMHQQRAHSAETRGDFGSAVREYRTLTKALPGNAELESNLGVALYFDHAYREAAEVLKQAIVRNAALYAPHLFLGLTLAHLGRPDAAVAELERAVSMHADDALAHTWLGYELTAESRFEKAAAELETAARLKPQDQDVWFALGRCYLELGKRTAAELLRVAPESARAAQLAAEQYEAQGNQGKALALYEVALERRPDLAGVKEKVAILRGGERKAESVMPAGGRSSGVEKEDRLYAEAHGDAERARAALQRVAEIAPDSYRAHEVMGDAAAAAEHFDEAAREYRTVVEKNPELPGVYGDLCNALSRTVQLDAAVKACDAEVRISPYSAAAYVQAARVRLLGGDESRAAELLKTGLSLDRPPALAYKLLAKIDLGAGRYGAAVEEMRKYLARESGDASGYFLLARAYKGAGESGKANEAIGDYKRMTTRGRASQDVRKVLDAERERDSEESGAAEKEPI